MKTFCCIITFFLFSAIKVFSNTSKELYFSSLDLKNGLSNSAVLSFYQDNDGLMWIGTYDGLNCYDGNSIEIFRTDFSDKITFNNNVIANISYAGKNNVWICSYHGVSLMSLYSHKVIANFSMEEDFKLYSSSDGQTWALDDSSIYYFNNYEKRFIKACPNPGINPEKSTAYVGKDGILTLISNGKKSSFNCMVSSFEKDSLSTKVNIFEQDIHNCPIIHSFCHKGVCCFVDVNNNLYVYDMVRKSKILITNTSSLVEKYGDISGIIPFYDDIIVYFHSQSIVRLEASRGYLDELLKRNVRVFCTYSDTKHGILWIGTDGQGIISIAQKDGIVNNIPLYSISQNLSGQVRGMLTDSLGTLWVGTKGDGLLSIPEYNKNINPNKIKVYVPGNKIFVKQYDRRNCFYPVFSLSRSHNFNGFWVGMSDSLLYYYSYKKDMIEPLNMKIDDKVTEIHGVYEQGDSAIWIATVGSGLKKMKIKYTENGPIALHCKNYHFFSTQRELLSLSSIISYKDSILWIGTRGSGLICFNMNKEEYKVISLKMMLEKYVDDILALHLDTTKSTLYIGSTAGLVSIDLKKGKTGKPFYFGRENGLFNDMIHGIVSDKNGILWLGTNKGLVKYNPANGMYYTYYYSRGVDISEFSDDSYYTCPYTENLFLGGINGLLFIDSKVVKKPDFYPDIILRNISFGYVKRYWTELYDNDKKTLVFPKDKNTFSITFSVPDYMSKDIEYSFLLEGYNNDWSDFSRGNEAFFSNVPPGKYVFKVKYKKDVLDSTYKEFSIPLTVTGTWYMSWWAYMMYLCIGISLLFVFLKLHKTYLSKHTTIVKNKTDDISHITVVDNINKSSYDIIIEKLGNEIKEYLTINNLEQADFLLKVITLIDEHLDMENLSISYLSDKCNLSTRQFYRKFKECIIISPIDLVKRMRMEKAATLLETTDMSIQEVIEKIGISSRSYFYKEFTAKYGVTPGAIRDKSVTKYDKKA